MAKVFHPPPPILSQLALLLCSLIKRGREGGSFQEPRVLLSLQNQNLKDILLK